jgi:hypothetical protein
VLEVGTAGLFGAGRRAALDGGGWWSRFLDAGGGSAGWGGLGDGGFHGGAVFAGVDVFCWGGKSLILGAFFDRGEGDLVVLVAGGEVHFRQ